MHIADAECPPVERDARDAPLTHRIEGRLGDARAPRGGAGRGSRSGFGGSREACIFLQPGEPVRTERLDGGVEPHLLIGETEPGDEIQHLVHDRTAILQVELHRPSTPSERLEAGTE